MDSKNVENKQSKKSAENGWSIDAKNVATAAFNDEIINPVKESEEESRGRLEINIINTTDKYQEVEIIYGDKKKRKRITKFLPKNFANIVYAIAQKPSPSSQLGATNLGNLSQKNTENTPFLAEKFLRILAKINQISDPKTPQKLWDSDERINTTEKAILVAAMNRFKPQTEQLNRLIVSMRSHEISDQKSFNNFILQIVDLTKNPQKLAKILFGNALQNLPEDKKNNLENSLSNIINENDDARRSHQFKFLQKIVNEIGNVQMR